MILYDIHLKLAYSDACEDFFLGGGGGGGWLVGWMGFLFLLISWCDDRHHLRLQFDISLN